MDTVTLMSRTEAVAVVGRVMAGAHASEDELNACPERLDRALACPTGYVSDLIHWPPEGELTPEEVVAHALAHRPIAL
ncbi:e9imm peptide [Streptomyces californicus]|uniref:e9imm peptide n=1 Tax=Streptomyces californicus TaxID=67351 RepID=UPI00367C61B7